MKILHIEVNERDLSASWGSLDTPALIGCSPTGEYVVMRSKDGYEKSFSHYHEPQGFVWRSAHCAMRMTQKAAQALADLEQENERDRGKWEIVHISQLLNKPCLILQSVTFTRY